MNVELLNLLKSNHTGKDRAIKRRVLAKTIYDPKDGPGAPWTKQDIERAERDLRADISEWNKAGEPILSGQGGIFYSDKIEDIESWAKFYRAMGLSNLEKADDLDNIAKEIRNKGQGILYPEKAERIII